jgi:hypothetical protein
VSEDLLQRQKRRELRGSILRVLKTVYGRVPETVSLRTIGHVLRDSSERAISEELQYLVDLGYALRSQDKRDALDQGSPVFYRLSPTGMQVLNGDREDKSIETT